MSSALRIVVLAVLAVLASGCPRPPTPEELADQTANDLQSFWQEAVATARITNTMQVRDEFFDNVDGLNRYPSSSRPTIPDSSETDGSFDDLRALTKRLFVQANVISSGGSSITFRVTGADWCTPLHGDWPADTKCVENVDALKLALRATGGSGSVSLTLLLDDTIEIATGLLVKGSAVSLTVDLGNTQKASEFFNSVLGLDSPFRDVTMVGAGKLEAMVKKLGPSDFEATFSFLSDASFAVTDRDGFSRSGKAAARAPAIALRVEGPAKSVTASMDLGACEYRGLWSDFFDYRLKTQMAMAIPGFGFKAVLQDAGPREITAVTLGPGPATLAYGGQTVLSATLNPDASNRFDLELSAGTRGLEAITVRPGFFATLNLDLRPVANAGSDINPKISNSTFSWEASSSDSAPAIELTPATSAYGGAFRLTNGKISLSSPDFPPARVFDAPVIMTTRGVPEELHPLLDFLTSYQECAKPADCLSGTICIEGRCIAALPQSAVCAKLVSCYDATQSGSSLESTYGPGGTCWTSGQSMADSCTSACTDSLASFKEAYPDVAACQ